MSSTLRPLALSVPHWPIRCTGSPKALSSRTPFSLLNALRGAFLRLSDNLSAWSRSAWSESFVRTDSVGIADDWNTAETWLQHRLNTYDPNLILLGAMTISAHGAILAAQFIRKSKCVEALIVLGGKHVTETMWVDREGVHIHPGAFSHHANQEIDLFVSGDGEEVIAEIGEAVAQTDDAGITRVDRIKKIVEHLRLSLRNAPGDWALFWFEEGSLKYLCSAGEPARPDDYPIVYEKYPINARFPILPGKFTAHGYSYTSKGCIHRCYFCSESADINGSVKGLKTAGQRLARQIARLARVAENNNIDSLSVFIEDSILLQGAPAALEQFCRELDQLGTRIKFGGQFTTDMVLDPKRQRLISELVKRGLCYVFMGIETNDDAIAAAMAKYSTSIKRQSGNGWIDRVELAIEELRANNVDTGVSVLFGLGESQDLRLSLLRKIAAWQRRLGQPRVVSLNWAVMHPMRSRSESQSYTFDRWPVDFNDPRLDIIQTVFGEASTNFCLPGCEMASLEELQQIKSQYLQLSNEV